MKGSNDAMAKGKIYQTKTVSDKNLPTGNNDLTLTLYLNKLIDQYQIQEIENFISQQKPSSRILENAISLSLKKYNLGDKNKAYELAKQSHTEMGFRGDITYILMLHYCKTREYEKVTEKNILDSIKNLFFLPYYPYGKIQMDESINVLWWDQMEFRVVVLWLRHLRTVVHRNHAKENSLVYERVIHQLILYQVTFQIRYIQQ